MKYFKGVSMKKITLLITFSVVSAFAFDFNAEMNTYLDSLRKEVKSNDSNFVDFDAKRGETLFYAAMEKEGKPISCASCHNKNLTLAGENIKTGKVIDPLAPSANTTRLTDVKEVQKWLRRNFKDVYGREGSAREKGDVLTFISAQ